MRIFPGLCLTWLPGLLPATHALAHMGELDPSFGNGGIAYFPLSENGSCLACTPVVAASRCSRPRISLPAGNRKPQWRTR